VTDSPQIPPELAKWIGESSWEGTPLSDPSMTRERVLVEQAFAYAIAARVLYLASELVPVDGIREYRGAGFHKEGPSCAYAHCVPSPVFRVVEQPPK
jgi:hypothetical protein